MKKLRAGLYGGNGHQIHGLLASHDLAEVVACAAFPVDRLTDAKAVRVHESFEALLSDPEVDFVSLCSPRRRDQARDAILALRAGKHVYAEKPCAMTEVDLDAILQVAEETGCIFREMAGTAFDQPYLTMREIVGAGRIGEVVQVIAEKSYPYFEGRPQDEDVDGGLIGQCSVHALRFVEHVAGVEIQSISAAETTFGNPVTEGGLRMACCLIGKLKNGGLASIAANYLNPRGTGAWGYETLRILGTLGMVESTQGGGHTRLVIGGEDLGPLDTSKSKSTYFDDFLRLLKGEGSMPLSLAEEISPTRWTIRAKAQLASRG